MSRSRLIRDLVTDGLRRASLDEAGARIAEGYRRIPQAQPDEWGEIQGGSDAATELGREDGMPSACCLTLDNVSPIRAARCTELITRLSPRRMAEVCAALVVATARSPP